MSPNNTVCKLSKKQKEVYDFLKENNTTIVLMKGLKPSCFIRYYLEYPISIATLYALEEKHCLEVFKQDWNSAEYKIKPPTIFK